MSGGTYERIVLAGMAFQSDGSIVMEYCIPGLDALRNGIVLNHTLLVPTGADYDDEIDDVRRAVIALVDDVLEDLPHLERISLEPPTEDDDEGDDDDDDEDDDEDENE